MFQPKKKKKKPDYLFMPFLFKKLNPQSISI